MLLETPCPKYRLDAIKVTLVQLLKNVAMAPLWVICSGLGLFTYTRGVVKVKVALAVELLADSVLAEATIVESVCWQSLSMAYDQRFHSPSCLLVFVGHGCWRWMLSRKDVSRVDVEYCL